MRKGTLEDEEYMSGFVEDSKNKRWRIQWKQKTKNIQKWSI